MADQSNRKTHCQDRQPGREQDMETRPLSVPRYPGSARLEGRVALITGGDSGIGRAVARLFAREGARIVILYLEELEDARHTEAKVQEEGRECLTIAGDVADESFCRDAVKKAIEQFGRLDCLVNNCAEQHPTSDIREITTTQLRRTFETNVFGYFYMTKSALAHLPRGGTIINTTSVTAYRGSHHLIDYASTRGAIVAFTRSLADSLVGDGIRVNGVAPGPIWTPLIPASFPKEKVEDFGKDSPMGRPGEPNEVAPCHLFLACDDSSYMTGQILHPNGGEVIGG